MDQKNCMYCSNDNRVKDAMTEVCRLNRSIVYLLNDQSFRGRCVVVYHKHITELFQLSPEDRRIFMDEVAEVAKAIYQLVQPQKINYAVFGDTVPHIHFHLVPKYQDGPLWGQAFCADSVPAKHLSDDEFANLLSLLRQNLKGKK
jgi:ATP adenylyltransferase